MTRRLVPFLVAASLLAAACGDDDSGEGTATTTASIQDDDDWDDEEWDDEEWDDDWDDEGADGDDRPSIPAGGVDDGTFVPGECPVDTDVAVEVECGVVVVPESRTGLSDAMIELAVVIIKTPVADPAPDPVIFLAGGPGQSAIAEFEAWVPSLELVPAHAFFSTRDLILIDQRGIGFSRPALDCDPEEDDCAARLRAEGVELAAYSTPENAADIAAVRNALGYDEWNLYGNSYGTRLALVVQRDHPEGVRSSILSGVYPPDTVPAYHDYVGNSLRWIEVLAAECARQSECSDTFGDIDDLLLTALEAVEFDNDEYEAQELYDAVFQAMYSMGGVQAVPYALWLTANGEVDDAFELLSDAASGVFGAARSGDGSGFSDGLFNSIECREEHAFTDRDVLEALAEEYIQSGVNELLVTLMVNSASPDNTVCAGWDSGVASEREREPATSDIPTLLLSGEYDPITPPSWGDIAAASLPRGTHIVVPYLSHGHIDLDQCIDDIVIAFLDDPTGAVDSNCVAAMDPPRFLTP